MLIVVAHFPEGGDIKLLQMVRCAWFRNVTDEREREFVGENFSLVNECRSILWTE